MKSLSREMRTGPSSQTVVHKFERLQTHMLVIPGLITPILMQRLAFKRISSLPKKNT